MYMELLLSLLLARFINHQDVVFDEWRRLGSFGCRQCRQVTVKNTNCDCATEMIHM